MALDAYLSLTGETQGNIEGGVTLQGLEGTIAVHAVYHEVVSPRDAASGLPTGKRQHAPLTIVKAIDQTTPVLAQLLYNNENITDLRLDFYRPTQSGSQVQHYTIELENAKVSGIRTEMLNNKYPENASHQTYERVSFTYATIRQIFQDGGIETQDDWEQSNV